jgi:pimeloyl-ACP methyl ester carboxylesterase
VTDAPQIRYTRSADGTNLAYQVSGDGPLDLVFLHGSAIPIDLLSDEPGFIRVRKRLDSFSRTMWFDARGLGASEGDAWDFLAGDIFDADLTALLDAVGFQRPALVAEDGNGLRAIRFSVAHPERVSALVLVNSYAHYVREDDYPWGLPPESLDRFVASSKDRWATAAALEILAPSRVADQRFRAWYTRSVRFFGGPDQIGDLVRAGMEDNVRPVLPSILVPTLVLHREGNRYIQVGAGRYLADHIPGARLVVLPGELRQHLCSTSFQFPYGSLKSDLNSTTWAESHILWVGESIRSAYGPRDS